MITWTLQVYIGSSWTDISNDVIKEFGVIGSWGIRDNTFFDRIADTGEMTFSLKNDDFQYSPDHASALTGWKKGLPVKLTLTFDGVSYIRFYGHIDSMKVDVGIYGRRRTVVTCVDWMDYTSKYPINLATLQTDKRTEVALNTIVEAIYTQPLNKVFADGDSTFPTVFDAVTPKTKALSEISKLINSEIGYFYLKKDQTYGETLVFENNSFRKGYDALTNIPLVVADCGSLLTEAGDTLVQEDGYDILLDETQTLELDNNMNKAYVEYGKNVVNFYEAKAYPKKVDTSVSVLYSLSYPLQIASGETKVVKGNYKDPSGGNAINAQSTTMLTPVINTDYKVWTASDGTGTDLTTDLAVTAVYGTEAVQYTLTNANAKAGYITLLQARGYGIYSYEELVYTEDNTASQNLYGYEPEMLNQIYQQDLGYGKSAAQSVVELEKEPRTLLKTVTFWTTTNELTQAFLNLDVGDIISVKEDQSGVDGYYYIQAVNFEVHPKGVVMCTWLLRQFFSLASGLSLIGCEFTGASTDSIDFGSIPAISNTRKARSFSAWIYLDADPPGNSNFIISNFTDSAGFSMSVHATRLLQYYQKGETGTGIWNTAGSSIPTTTWTNVIVTINSHIVTNAPIVYIDGVSQALTQTSVQVGATVSEEGANFAIGNVKTVTLDYNHPFDGKITDVRVYDRILNATEAAQIHTEGIGGTGVMGGMVFQGPCVRTKELTDYTDLTLTSATKLLDVVRGYVGTPNGAPISRLNP